MGIQYLLNIKMSVKKSFHCPSFVSDPKKAIISYSFSKSIISIESEPTTVARYRPTRNKPDLTTKFTVTPVSVVYLSCSVFFRY